ncbi:MAG TPA: hypothetical protein VJN96_20455 [Vicinamibacterales bacterium]|nr:hypothetical protein [Vicinamibacterales bacterium]
MLKDLALEEPTQVAQRGVVRCCIDACKFRQGRFVTPKPELDNATSHQRVSADGGEPADLVIAIDETLPRWPLARDDRIGASRRIVTELEQEMTCLMNFSAVDDGELQPLFIGKPLERPTQLIDAGTVALTDARGDSRVECFGQESSQEVGVRETLGEGDRGQSPPPFGGQWPGRQPQLLVRPANEPGRDLTRLGGRVLDYTSRRFERNACGNQPPSIRRTCVRGDPVRSDLAKLDLK